MIDLFSNSAKFWALCIPSKHSTLPISFMNSTLSCKSLSNPAQRHQLLLSTFTWKPSCPNPLVLFNYYRWTVLPSILSLHSARSPFFKPPVTTHCAPLGPGDSATYFYFYCSYTPLLVPISVSINYYHNNAMEQASTSNFSSTQ